MPTTAIQADHDVMADALRALFAVFPDAQAIATDDDLAPLLVNLTATSSR